MIRFIQVLVVVMVLIAVIFAQETPKAEGKTAAMVPVAPIDDAFYQWMVGEWEGWTESNMVKSKEQVRIEWALDRQFLVMYLESKGVEFNEKMFQSMGEKMKMTPAQIEEMKNKVYRGMGLYTIDPKTGEEIGYWFDNWRGFYQARGKRDGEKIIMNWEGPMGTSTRTIEKISADKMLWKFEEKTPDGQIMSGKTELTRKK